MKFLRILLYVLLVLVAFFVLFLAYAGITNYRPPETEVLLENPDAPALPDSLEFSIFNWNIGYGGLDASMDFFYDGGKLVRPEKQQVEANLAAIEAVLTSQDQTPFLFLQEVDQKSKRSYRINEYERIAALLGSHMAAYGKNYDVAFVPLPPSKPMGAVNSGLMTLSATAPSQVERHSFPGNYSWPMSLFMLDRCFLVHRFPLEGGVQLVLVNTHNSAYDDGSLRDRQMEYMKEFLMQETENGNHVIVGGDWNQTPEGKDPEFDEHPFDRDDYIVIPEDYPAPDWHWVYDPSVPTNRRVAAPYEKGTTPTTLIDCFLVSPGIAVLDRETFDLNFAHSDHHPIRARFRLTNP